MRRVLPLFILPVICMTAQAQSTGRVSGRVVNSAGKPVAGAKLTFKRTDINQTIELTTNADGRYFRIMDPKEFDITIEAAGFNKMMDRLKVPLGNEEKRNFTLLTPQESAKTAGAADPAAAAQNESANAYNSAVGLFNEQKFTEALPFAETAHKVIAEAIEKAKDDAQKKEANEKLAAMEKLLAVVYFEAGKKIEERRTELFAKAEPMLVRLLEASNPKSLQYATYLAEIARVGGKAEDEKKYNAIVDTIQGPRADRPYNEGVEAFNAGNFPAAKTFLEKAIQVDPKFEKSYYLLGMVEYSLMNMKGAKGNLQKYLELAPNGDKAAEVKEMLKDPSFKNIK